jgi:aspartate kinase
MRILVQKFGGTSLSSMEARVHVINHIKRALVESFNLVIVVSAMGRRGDPYATDTLLDWVGLNGNQLSPRELDMILCCGETISAVTLCSLLNAEHIEATVLNGEQAGIVTNNQFGKAQILSINPQRIIALLSQQKVVIVTGFQGATIDHDFTTLGRGGSDTSATALGVALKAEMVDIFTDVNGVLTADPRIVEDAKPLSHVTYNEICHLAHHGAKVIHPRAVEIAMQANLPVRIRSTFSEGKGTLVASLKTLKLETNSVIDRYITGIAHVPSLTQLTVLNGEGQYDTSLHVFKVMAQHKISVDFINVNPTGVIYTVFERDAALALEALKPLNYHVKCVSHCAKVSVIGGGMNEVPGIMANIVEALMNADITILQSSDSHTTIWVLVYEADMILAVRTLHAQFKLSQ